MTTKEQQTAREPFQTISVPDESIAKPKLRLIVTIIVTVVVGVLIILDQFLGLWPLGFYWFLFATGLIVCCIFIWILCRWGEPPRPEGQGLLAAFDKRNQKEGDETFLEKWGDEIGWPLMVLAFTIQFFIPQVRPLLFGAIVGGSWFRLLGSR